MSGVLRKRLARLESETDQSQREGRYALRRIAIVAEGEPVPAGFDEVIELVGVDPAPRMALLARLRGEP